MSVADRGTGAGTTRRSVLKAGALAPLWLTAKPDPGPHFRIGRRRAPNVLFVHTDQQSLETLSGLGCAHVHTPNLDRLMARGTTFRQSYCTDPVCSPARAGWYTGRPSSETGVVENRRPLHDSVPDLGQLLRAGGVDGYYIGKWHIRGRDVARSFRLVADKGLFFGLASDRALSVAATSFLREHRGAKPFLLNVGFVQPHDINFWFGRHAPQPATIPDSIRGELPPLPPNPRADHEEPAEYRRMRKRWLLRHVASWREDDWRMYLWVYLRYVEMVDAEVGRVLDVLASSRHGASTAVIFSSDHGEGMAAHGLVNKGHFYESALRVPLVVSWPEGGIARGRMDDEHLVSGLDVLPTICDLMGVDTPDGLRGASLRALAAEDRSSAERGAWRERLFAEHQITGRMVRSDRYKLIAYEGDERELFFDVRADPFETRNLVGESEHEAELERHRGWIREREAGLAKVPLGEK